MKSLIIGGTGTLGRHLIERLLETTDSHVVCFSRDELKQKDLKRALHNNDRLEFILGDVRDPMAVDRATRGVDVVFHVAALKHVDSGEDNPEEFLHTNTLGVENVADACEANGVSLCVFSSTDKAVMPINAYGMTKALAEKILIRRNQTQSVTKYKIFRWGNVVGSRGSIIPVFRDAVAAEKPVPITDFAMTRFWIRIEDAVSFMLNDGGDEPIMIPPIKAAPVTKVVETLAKLMGKEQVVYEKVPIRPGEKIHEWLTPNLNSQDGPQYSESELTELLRAYV